VKVLWLIWTNLIECLCYPDLDGFGCNWGIQIPFQTRRRTSLRRACVRKFLSKDEVCLCNVRFDGAKILEDRSAWWNRGRSPSLAVKTFHLDERLSAISRRHHHHLRDTLFAIEKRVSDKENRTTGLGHNFENRSHQRGERVQKEQLEQQR